MQVGSIVLEPYTTNHGGKKSMSLIYCPECGHEISNSAVACPNCGRPINATPVVERKVVVAPTPLREKDGFPPWAFIPIGLLGLILLAVIFFMFRGPDDEANANIRVTANTRSTGTTQIPTRTEAMPEDIRTSPDVVHTTSVPGSASKRLPSHRRPIKAV